MRMLRWKRLRGKPITRRASLELLSGYFTQWRYPSGTAVRLSLRKTDDATDEGAQLARLPADHCPDREVSS